MRYPKTEEGLTTLILYKTQTLEQRASKVDGPIVTMETYWNGEKLWVQNLYRGLFAISASNNDNSFSMDFEYDMIDDLFPLAVGKVITFPAKTIVVSEDAAINTLVTITVTQETKIIINGETIDIFIIETVSEHNRDNLSSSHYAVQYYAPALGIVVKQIDDTGNGAPIYWDVVEINKQPRAARKKDLNRSGTLII